MMRGSPCVAAAVPKSALSMPPRACASEANRSLLYVLLPSSNLAYSSEPRGRAASASAAFATGSTSAASPSGCVHLPDASDVRNSVALLYVSIWSTSMGMHSLLFSFVLLALEEEEEEEEEDWLAEK